MKLYFKFFNLLIIPFLITGAAFSDINKTTDRYIRDKYGCMITTQERKCMGELDSRLC